MEQQQTYLQKLYEERFLKDKKITFPSVDYSTTYFIYVTENNVLDVKIIDYKNKKYLDTVFCKSENYGNVNNFGTFKNIITHIRTTVKF